MAASFDPGTTSRLLNSITTNQSGLRTSLAQIASGKRITTASIDPAGLAISEQLRSDIAALSQTVRNVESGANFVRAAEGGLANITELTGRARELALQAANGTLGDTERATINEEFQQVLSEIDRVTQTQEFNGQRILDGSLGSASPTQIDIQAGIGSGPENQINLNVVEDTSTAALGIAGLDISTAAGALAAFDPLEQAQETVIHTRGEVGAVSNRLEITANNTRNTIVNLEASRSEIADTDIAAQVSELKNTLLRVESSIRALGIQTRQNESNVGRILNINT